MAPAMRFPMKKSIGHDEIVNNKRQFTSYVEWVSEAIENV
jgi:hypothetical protein